MLPNKKNRHVETSLIEAFSYPKLGPGELWDVTAEEIEKLGGHIVKNARVVGVTTDSGSHLAKSVKYIIDGKEETADGDIVVPV